MGEAETGSDGFLGAQSMWRAQIENLYIEAMVLADEAYAGFAAARDLKNDPVLRDRGQMLSVALACESLKTTTRLMHIIAWLLHQRAMLAGEPSAHADDSAGKIGESIPADWKICCHFDASLGRIITASERLFDRIAALDAGQSAAPVPPPVHRLMAQLEARF